MAQRVDVLATKFQHIIYVCVMQVMRLISLLDATSLGLLSRSSVLETTNRALIL